jgi:hypothetical protein
MRKVVDFAMPLCLAGVAATLLAAAAKFFELSEFSQGLCCGVMFMTADGYASAVMAGRA